MCTNQSISQVYYTRFSPLTSMLSSGSFFSSPFRINFYQTCESFLSKRKDADFFCNFAPEF